MQNKKNIENKKNFDAEGKFDARWDDKLKFFFRGLKINKLWNLIFGFQLWQNLT